jgi:hypothetical protein
VYSSELDDLNVLPWGPIFFNWRVPSFDRTSYKESLDLHMASVHKAGDLPKRVISRKLKKEKFDEPLTMNPDQNSIFLSEICVDL